jgi:heme-degrading monooxygenase HmoA
MAHVLVHHKVADYAKWKPVFDKHSSIRAQNGSRGGKVFRNVSNPNDLFLLLEWDTLENAQKFSQSENLKEAMQDAGVEGIPEIYFVEEAAVTSK